MSNTWPNKDPNEVLDYQINWTQRLDGDTITGTPTWTVPAGITKDSQSNTDTETTVWLSGGTASETYTITCVIVTTGGRTMETSVFISVVNSEN